MKIIIERPPYSINEQGDRKNNEDDLFPAKWEVSRLKNLFLVCDGVGGNAYGEYASRTACEAIPEYFLKHSSDRIDEDYVRQAIKHAKQRFSEFGAEHPDAEGMSTTLTLLSLNRLGATAAWIGDSRIYHIRDGSIMWKSRDHSYVNELVAAGAITEEEAIDHSKRNIITRSLNANSNDKPDIKILDDIQKGDYFFLCTDGVLENISDEQLVEILEDKESDTRQKRNQILDRCLGRTRDNFTCYLIRIERVEAEKEDHTIVMAGTKISHDEDIPVAKRVDQASEDESEQSGPEDTETTLIRNESVNEEDVSDSESSDSDDCTEPPAPKKKNGFLGLFRRGNDKPNYLGWFLTLVLVGLIVFSYFYFIKDKGLTESEKTETPGLKAVSDSIYGYVLQEVKLEWEIAGDENLLLRSLIDKQLILEIFDDAGGLILDHIFSGDDLTKPAHKAGSYYLQGLFSLPDTGIYKAVAYVKSDTSVADLSALSDTIIIFSGIPTLNQSELFTQYNLSRFDTLPLNIAKKDTIRLINHFLIPDSNAGSYLFLTIKQDLLPAIYNQGLVSDTSFQQKFYLALFASLNTETFSVDKIQKDTTIADYWKLDFENDSLFISGIAQPNE